MRLQGMKLLKEKV